MGLHIPQVRWLSVPRLPVYAARLACLLHAVRFAAMNPLTEALLLAVAPRDIRACPALLDAGASVNARDSNSPTPLHAAISGHQDVCELLLDRKASINARDITNGADPNAFNVPILHIAALTEGSSVSPTLLAEGVKFDAKLGNGMTALHAAAIGGDLEFCKLLVDTAKDQQVEIVNLARNDGVTPLHLAALINSKPIVKLLLDNNADPNCRTKCRKPTETKKTCTRCDTGHWSPADLPSSEDLREILSDAASRSSLQTETSTTGQPASSDDSPAPKSRESEARSELDKEEHILSELHTHLMGMGNANFWLGLLNDRNALPSDSLSDPRDILAHFPLIWSPEDQAFLDKDATTEAFTQLLHPDVPDSLKPLFGITNREELLRHLSHYQLSFARDFTFEVILKLQDLFKAFGIPEGHPESVRQAVLEERLMIGSASPIRRFIIWNARNQQLQHCHGLRVSDLCRLMQQHPEVEGHVRNGFSMCSNDGSAATVSDFHSFRGSFTPEFYPRRFALKDSLYEQRLDVLAILLSHVLDRYGSCRPPVDYVEFSVGVGDVCRTWVFDVLRCFGSDGTSSFRNREWLAKRLIPKVSVSYKFLAGFGRHNVELEPRGNCCLSDAERSNRFLLERPQRAISNMLREIHASKNGAPTEIFKKFEADLRKVERVWNGSEFSHDWLVGFDLFGDELGFPYCPFVTSRFLKFVQVARLRNPRFGLRIHCAENVPLIRPSEPGFRMFMAHMYIVFRGLEYLVSCLGGRSIRIGHGVAFSWFLQPSRDQDVERKSSVLAEEIRALAPIALSGVIFEVNPTSNLYLLPEALRSHQFALFKERQLFPRTTLATDDDGVWPIDHCRLHHHGHHSLAAEYCDAISKFSLTPEQVRSMIRAGVGGRFYDSAVGLGDANDTEGQPGASATLSGADQAGTSESRGKCETTSTTSDSPAQHHRVVVLPHVVAMRYFSRLQSHSSSDEFDAHYRQLFRLESHFASETRLYFADLLLSKLQPLIPSPLQIQMAECAFLQSRFPDGHRPDWIPERVWDECTLIVDKLVLCEEKQAFFTFPQLADSLLHCVYSDVTPLTQPESDWNFFVTHLVDSLTGCNDNTRLHVLEVDCFLLGSATTPEAQQNLQECLLDSVRQAELPTRCQVVLRVWTGDKSHFSTRVEANITLQLNSSAKRLPASFLYSICTHGDAATFAFHKLAEDPNLILAAKSHQYSATPPEAPSGIATTSTGVGVEPGQNAPFLNTGSAATEQRDAEPPAPGYQDAEPPASEHQDAEPPASEHQDTEPPASEHQDAEPPTSEHQDAEPPASEHQDAEPPASEHQDAEPPTSEQQDAEPPAPEHQDAEPPTSEHQDAEPPASEHQDAEPPAPEHPDTEREAEDTSQSALPVEEE